MASQTNLDHSKETHSNIPQLEFTLHINDVDQHPQIGERGTVAYDVECVAATKDSFSFRKCGGPAKLTNFSQRNLEDMEYDLGEGSQPEDRPRK